MAFPRASTPGDVKGHFRSTSMADSRIVSCVVSPARTITFRSLASPTTSHPARRLSQTAYIPAVRPENRQKLAEGDGPRRWTSMRVAAGARARDTRLETKSQGGAVPELRTHDPVARTQARESEGISRSDKSASSNAELTAESTRSPSDWSREPIPTTYALARARCTSRSSWFTHVESRVGHERSSARELSSLRSCPPRPIRTARNEERVPGSPGPAPARIRDSTRILDRAGLGRPPIPRSCSPGPAPL